MSERYRPSNGTEGEGFISCWCAECERDREYRERDVNPCEILNRALIFQVEDAEYPDEWTYDEEGNPCCTAFIAEGGQAPTDVELEAEGQINLLSLLQS